MAKVERLAEDIKELGMPEIFVSHNGISITLKPKECFINDSGFHFLDDNSNVVACISPGEVELKEIGSNYRRCYIIRQIRTDTMLGKIYWEG